MEKKITENAYFIEDIDSFCSSVQIFNPMNENQTFTVNASESEICDSVVKETEDR